jgi:hypothetical protein
VPTTPLLIQKESNQKEKQHKNNSQARKEKTKNTRRKTKEATLPVNREENKIPTINYTSPNIIESVAD